MVIWVPMATEGRRQLNVHAVAGYSQGQGHVTEHKPHHVLSHVHCATPIYSAVLLILRDFFCTLFATEEGPLGPKHFS